ncbi:MAG TPA: phosphoribosylamine--glycine ligase [Actinomycetota bacterium]
MRVLVVGGGGREHALAWKLRQSPSVDDVLVAPGNAGIASLARRVPVAVDDVDRIVDLAEREDADLTVVGPEAPLVAGLADALVGRGRRVFGPSAAAARLEGSKAFAKDLMRRHGIPTARSGTFTDVAEASAFVDELGGRAVVKADGLAAGKGVTVASDRASAIAALEDALARGAFGAAGSTVVVEEVLEGPEVSAFALLDGERVLRLGLAQDFKRIGDGDTGPNTGGMGAYAGLPWIAPDLEARIWSETVEATAGALAAEGIAYRGCLFAGLMLTADGPKVLEFNCRFGDPETEALLPRLALDLAETLATCADGRLDDRPRPDTGEAVVTVVLASGGYPGTYATGVPIDGLEAAAEVDGVTVFHAGTEDADGRVVTAGGRVLAVSALGASLREARARAYEACGRIAFDGMTYRRDIAERAAEGEETG